MDYTLQSQYNCIRVLVTEYTWAHIKLDGVIHSLVTQSTAQTGDVIFGRLVPDDYVLETDGTFGTVVSFYRDFGDDENPNETEIAIENLVDVPEKPTTGNYVLQVVNGEATWVPPAELTGVNSRIAFGTKDVSGIPSGIIPVIGGGDIGYIMPSDGKILAIGVLTDYVNSNDYWLKKNGTTVNTTSLTAAVSGVDDGLSLVFTKGDIFTMGVGVEVTGMDIGSPYTADANTLFLGHIDGDTKTSQHVTNSATTLAKGMPGRLMSGAVTNGAGKFNQCLDLTSGYVQCLHHDDYAVQDCTIEMWVNPSALPTWQTFFSKIDATNGIYIGANSDKLYVSVDDYTYTSGAVFSTGTWYHIAVVLGTGGAKVFLDGVLKDSDGTTTGMVTNRHPIALGASCEDTDKDYYKTVNYNMDGLLDEIRISDTRRYEAGFTAPTTEFTKDESTLALWHCNETSGKTIVDDSDTVQNAMMMADGSLCEPMTDHVKHGTHAIKMNGSKNDWLRVNHHPDYEATEITLEAWVWPHKDSRDGYIFFKGDSSVEGSLQVKWKKGDLALSKYVEIKYYGISTSRTLTTAKDSFKKDQWNHLSIVIHAEYIKVFVNGIQVDAEGLTTDYAGVWTNNKEPLIIGAHVDRKDYAMVYLDEIHISDTIRSYGVTPGTGITEVAVLVETE